jgi:hypothetical protein
MEVTDMDRINAVQTKLCEVKTWVDETLRILHYVCVDESHRAFKDKEHHQHLSEATDLYPGQIVDPTIAEEEESCTS